MSNDQNEEESYLAVSERHHQIMEEGTRFFRKLFYFVIGAVTLIVGFIIFLFWRY